MKYRDDYLFNIHLFTLIEYTNSIQTTSFFSLVTFLYILISVATHAVATRRYVNSRADTLH